MPIDTYVIRGQFLPRTFDPENDEPVAEEQVIAELCDEIDRLREALQKIVDGSTTPIGAFNNPRIGWDEAWNTARKALNGGEQDGKTQY